ncbi:hypothetical protein PAMA_012931 [Pampus argenteus]
MLSHDEASNVSEILSAIQSLSKDLNAQLGEVRNDFSTKLHNVISSNHEIKEAIDTFSERLTQAESCISAAEDRISSLTEATDTTREKIHKLDMQMEEIENQRRRCNLKLVGIPEGFEKRWTGASGVAGVGERAGGSRADWRLECAGSGLEFPNPKSAGTETGGDAGHWCRKQQEASGQNQKQVQGLGISL